MSSGDQRVLRNLKVEIDALSFGGLTTTSSSRFVSWRSRSRSALARILGADHPITESFTKIHWTSGHPGDLDVTSQGAEEASGYLDAAAFEVQALASIGGAFDAAGVDPELWEHVAGHVAGGAWATVASQTAIFTEDRIRRWTGQSADLVGERLMTAVLGDAGAYRLGMTSGENQGWHRLGMGISMALRNVDAHRIQTRPDLHLYALGVVGVSSLLLTQLRYEHGNRFHNIAPVPPLISTTTADAAGDST